jgi:hypothetical protein
MQCSGIWFAARARTVLAEKGILLASGIHDLLIRRLSGCSAACQEMQHKQDEAHNQGDVNETCGHVKCEKAKHPKNDQYGGDYSKHLFISLIPSVGIFFLCRFHASRLEAGKTHAM